MLKKYKESEYAIKISELWKKLDLNFTVSGSIESDILMSPETGNFFKSATQITVSGGYKSNFLMPPETGNLLRCVIRTYRLHVQMLQVGQIMAMTVKPPYLCLVV